MRSLKCDLCGDDIQEGKRCAVAVVLPSNRPLTPGEEFAAMVSGGARPPNREIQEYDACKECAMSFAIALKERVLQIKRRGELVSA